MGNPINDYEELKLLAKAMNHNISIFKLGFDIDLPAIQLKQKKEFTAEYK